MSYDHWNSQELGFGKRVAVGDSPEHTHLEALHEKRKAVHNRGCSCDSRSGDISGARADEAHAKSLLKAMSDYLGAQKAISFEYDTNLEISLAPKSRRSLGHSGSQSPGQASHNGACELRDKYHRPVPGADLLIWDPYDQLMLLVEDVKDFGSGVIRGTECDHLAFRTKDVDWQIWIARSRKEPVPIPAAMSSPAGRLRGRRNTSSTSGDGRRARRWRPIASNWRFRRLNPDDVLDLNEIPRILSREGAK
jgi:hypothetical protein